MYKLGLKRFMDLTASLVICSIVFPFFVLLFILVKLDSRGGFFFLQERLGRNGKVFHVFKIRTMIDRPRSSHQEVYNGNSEVTSIGSILRRLKIDELPQLLNILNGDMSFVGPRPCLPSLRDSFNDDGWKRLDVRPGLTGLAQINGNIHLTWPERWKYDSNYVENVSFLLDVKIILKTVLIVIMGEEKFVKKPNA